MGGGHKEAASTALHDACGWDHRRSSTAAARGSGGLVAARWSPTPEQLQFLEDLYRHGITTPSADQIRHIVGKLRRFGRIEGKNVFYWFQNHKAREKQRKRRRLEFLLHHQGSHQFPTASFAQSLGTLPFKYPVPASMDDLIKTAESSAPSWPLDLESSSFMFTKSFSAQKVFGCENGNSFEFESCSDNSGEVKDTQTLDLFPTKKLVLIPADGKEEGESLLRTARLQPSQFFEFLPTREI